MGGELTVMGSISQSTTLPHKLAPRDEDFPLQIAYAYDKLGRFKEAEWMYYNAWLLDPKSTWVKYFYDRHLELWATGKSGVKAVPKTEGQKGLGRGRGARQLSN